MKRLFQNKKVLLLFVIVMLSQAVFISIITRFARMADYDSISWYWIPVIFAILCGIADVILFLSAVQMQERKISEQKNLLMNKELEEQLRHYDTIIEHLEKTSRFRHDFGNYMQTIYVLIDRGEYREAGELIDTLNEKISEVEL